MEPMRGDLRRLLWRLRAGVVRRAALEEAVAEACERLVERRFGSPVTRQETSPFAGPFLTTFESEVFNARLLAPQGEHRSAVLAVEAAGKALEAARSMAMAHAEWEEVAVGWRELQGRIVLDAPFRPATLREGESALAVAESFLGTGEWRKARFVVRQCRHALGRLTSSIPDGRRRSDLLRRLLDLRRSRLPPPASLVQLLGRLTDEGLAELAQRLLDDWEMESGEAGGAGSGPLPAIRGDLERITAVRPEAHRLARELALLAPQRAPTEVAGEITGEEGAEGVTGSDAIEKGE